MIGVYPIGVPADFIPVHYALALQRCSQFDEYLCSFERQSSQIQCIECSVVATFRSNCIESILWPLLDSRDGASDAPRTVKC